MTRIVALGLFVIFFISTLILSPRVGPSWDEPDNIFAAGQYINFFSKGMDPTILQSRHAVASSFNEKIYTQEPSLHRYPPVPLYLGIGLTWIVERLGTVVTSQLLIQLFHVASGIFWALYVVCLFLFARVLGMSLGISLITALIGGLHPTIVGYGISTIKDSAQVTLFVASLLLLVTATLKNNKRYLILGSLVWGLALATKINAVYVPVIWGAWAFVYSMKYRVWSRGAGVKTRFSLLGKEIVSLISKLLLIVCAGTAVMVVVWPYLWFDPVNRAMAALQYFTTVGSGYRVFWQGVQYMVGTGTALPWYPVVHFIVATPLPVLGLLVVGLGAMLYSIVRRKITKEWGELLLIVWAVFPLIRIFTPTAAFYDGFRHFLEVLPALTLCIGYGLHVLMRKVPSRTQATRIIPLLCIGVITHLLFINAMFFPYTTGYVNALMNNPNEQLDRDFSGLAIPEAIEIAHKVHPGFAPVFVPIGGHLSWYYLMPGDVYVYRIEDADIIILINKASHVSKAVVDGLLLGTFNHVGTVRRGNHEFAWVYVRM